MSDNEQSADWDHGDIPPPPPRLEQPVNAGNGRFMNSRNQDERCAWAAARWTINGWTLQEIADALDLGGKPSAHRYVQRGLRATRENTAATVEQARAAHRAHLGYALEVVTEIMGGKHPHISQGRVMKDANGTPIYDDGPRLTAAGKVKDLSESLRKLDGLDAPAKVEHSGGVTYEIVGVDPQDLQ